MVEISISVIIQGHIKRMNAVQEGSAVLASNAVASDRMGIRGVKLNLYRTTGGYSHVIEEDAH